ncbi:serine hydrolase [Altererythrobacter salegens]|uniref:Serine hydrolase n=1 Tax=Croceibacterium salegens TaxID=1737568 RepID=A0A6I4ST31_9SPHN|nr:serine hydrolase domain-containing protein [Croceibacterium salegens]MXO58689.1 serine hydrolase [Croceibacterium salegens]
MRFPFFPVFAAATLVACTSATPAIERTSPPATATNLTRASTEVLFWDDSTRADRFRHMEDYFPGIEVAPSLHPRVLPAGTDLPAAASGALDRYLGRGDIAGIMVLQDGKVRYEKYGLGFGPGQRWTSFSMAKSLTSTLAGAAIKDGYIKSLDEKVSHYIPGLAGSAYDDVTLEQLLTMTSGVAWNEDYADPNSDVARIFAVEPDPGESQVVTVMKKLPRDAAPGAKWVYKTGETNLVGELVEKATGRTLAEYAKAKVVDPAGLEGKLFWQTELTGGNVGGCCIELSMRDYARFGQFVLEGGHGSVAPGWLSRAGAQHVDLGQGFGYGYQWWTYPAGAFGAIGIFGQSITVFPDQQLVVVILGNWPKATGADLTGPRTALLAQVYAAVAAE